MRKSKAKKLLEGFTWNPDWGKKKSHSNFIPTTHSNLINKIDAWESGEMESEEEVGDFFQFLIDRDYIRHMQGMYQRTASYLIEAGLAHPKK